MIERRKFKRYMCDRRKFERYNINLPVSVETMPQAGLPEIIDYEGINLAAGGMFIKKGQSLPENSPIRIEIIFHFEELKTPENLEGALIMAVTGHVVRTEPAGTAVRFHDDYEMSQSLSILLGKAPEDDYPNETIPDHNMEYLQGQSLSALL
jgi:hypothetical protein